MKRFFVNSAALLVVILVVFVSVGHCQCSPIMGLGTAQFFNNLGAPLTNGVLYSFQAGTSTQQATFTDSTCTTQNVNPITFTTGARVNIWLTSGASYKFQLCLQNDGSTCAASDVLFSVDNVPGGGSGGGGSGGSPFISGSANPATAGILRLAAGDSVCWRNVANSANLCFTKDTNDLLSWAGGTFKLPEVAPPTSLAGFDILQADSTAHRFKQCSNAVSCTQIVNAGVDINGSDQVTQLHFGSTATPLGSAAPSTNNSFVWNGTNIVPGGVVYSTVSAATNASIGATTMVTAPASGATYRFSYYWTLTAAGVGCSTNSTLAMDLTYTDPNGGSPINENFAGDTITTNGALGQMIGHNTVNNIGRTMVIRASGATTISYFTTYATGTCSTSVPVYQVYPILEQLTVN